MLDNDLKGGQLLLLLLLGEGLHGVGMELAENRTGIDEEVAQIGDRGAGYVGELLGQLAQPLQADHQQRHVVHHDLVAQHQVELLRESSAQLVGLCFWGGIGRKDSFMSKAIGDRGGRYCIIQRTGNWTHTQWVRGWGEEQGDLLQHAANVGQAYHNTSK